MTLELKNVNQLFNNKDLFREKINLKIEKKSATLLYGGSGSGKTSIFNILIALAKPTYGELYWDGEKIDSLKEANAHRANYMSVLFSNFSFINELSIKDNILLGASLCKIENAEMKLSEIASELLNFKDIDANIDLENLMAKESVRNLSNGQKEIIAIASTLLINADFFIADEMLRSFPDQTKEILFKRLIAYFNEREIGFFYVTHWKRAKELITECEIKYDIYEIEDQKLLKKERR